MTKNYKKKYFEWLRSAEEAAKNRDYETAARLMRYISVYFGLINDPSKRREFAAKAGEFYFQAARKIENKNDLSKIILLYTEAAKCFQESGRDRLVQICNSLIWNTYLAISKSNLDIAISDLKKIGDYFRENGDNKNAVECYIRAAKKAYEQGRIALSGSLYADIGNCYRMLGDFRKAAESYKRAAERYFECERYFEAARHYCDSGFLYIRVQRLGEALLMAERAEIACAKGRIDILFNDLSRICRLLSRRDLQGAMEIWSKIRMKFKMSYIELVDSCFRTLRQTT